MSLFNLQERITVLAGSFFNEIPVEADAYILKNILPNWADEQARMILLRIRKVIPPHGKLLILEMVVPLGNKRSFAKMIDIQMLATMPGGKERTINEFKSLLSSGGFILNRNISTISPLSILECRPDPAYRI